MDRAEQDAVINLLRKVDREDAWPTSKTEKDLRIEWDRID
jgi:hypothetical protein